MCVESLQEMLPYTTISAAHIEKININNISTFEKHSQKSPQLRGIVFWKQ